MHIEVSRKLISTLRVWVCLALALIAFVCGIVSIFSSVVAIAVMTLAVVASAFASFYYIPRLWQSYDIEVTENALIISRGVYIRRRYIMPCPRMIYFERTQTILDRFFGVFSVRIHAARARLTVIGLERNEAMRLTALLSGESEL